MPQNKVLINEIFESIQGEGPYIGVNQLFIRFSKCNLKCNYCDTNFKTNLKEYTQDELINEINRHNNIHSVSLTGGEPLLEADFLMCILPNINKKVYLETNGTLYNELTQIIDYVDIISMDIKLPSATKLPEMFKLHENFISLAKNKELFLKVVFNSEITEYEIRKTIELAKKYNLVIILQPEMNRDILKIKANLVSEIYNKFVNEYTNVRLIPQVHKFLNFK